VKRPDLQLSSAAEQLAADEVFLDAAESGAGDEMLWFWEPQEIFVVAGYANQVATEVDVAACAKKNVPIFRRCSGGGAVVQLPGGLNYGLILRIDEHGPTRNITAANQFVMERNRAAIEDELKIQNSKLKIFVQGHTDLCVGDRKFAGNSQRRRKNFLLFHGTLLLNCELERISELLLMPSLQPDYRAQRRHENFVTNLGVPAEKIKAALAAAWGAKEKFKHPPQEKISRLAREKYSAPEWNLKF
jgi:lipoate-protein ligase A